MRVKFESGWNSNNGRETLIFSADLDQVDMKGDLGAKPRLARNSWFVDLVQGNAIDRIHPDLLGLASLLAVGPFVKDELVLPFGVSSEFSTLVERGLRKRIGPIDSSLRPRVCPMNHRPALAFSGGVDSCSALSLLPDHVVPVFMLRRKPDDVGESMYRPDAALASCDAVLSSGYDVRVMESSVEYVRDPVGFSVDWTNSLPIIVNADALSVSSVSFGMIMESAFYLGRDRFSDLSGRNIYRSWAPLFECVSVPISLPTSGLSEVLTTKISADIAAAFMPQSCVRGSASNPCMKCFKCFRKIILDSALRKIPVSADHYQIPFESREVRRKLLEVPIHHEIVMAWTLKNSISQSHPVLDALKLKLGPVSEYGNGLSFLKKIYPRSLSYIPESIRESVSYSLLKHSDFATDDEIKAIENWSEDELIKDPRYEAGQDRLCAILE